MNNKTNIFDLVSNNISVMFKQLCKSFVSNEVVCEKNTKECKNNNVDLQGIPTQFGPLSLFK